MPTRREVLQGLILSLGGATALSACGGAANILSTSPSSPTRFYTESEMALLVRVSDLIIPRTETPGALDVNVPGYLDGLMADWANTETQNAHRQALAQLSVQLSAELEGLGGNFVLAAQDEAEQALSSFDAAAFENANSSRGYRTLKGYITQAYFATEDGATEELKWVALPGRWDPSVDIPT